ncbi:ZmpA/ZmpB/ZmpC family metallo-endopeptidase [Streptococcus suis]|uniref:ZmpA/ZmpB/ZmpC family metallo-endopeptidase n=1 Tax=Streptococcus suis TaxID=1307 RepID=UPI00211C7547|nr:ZmpA/ZmpB/ZmpC family metallo-endopeptidase [Streptococcus suis]MCQ9225373.1 G5 domain-containing protein [Streptococcus suis]MCQ9227646.1 G5 domain-containing protein [Streptococcus suis]MCQ9241836.1 G5 domain-containing protein [Streptococcus suis]MCQ9273939.1 G5 domain-containing protein [Streptococcus suis]MDE7536243.1 ZmpA/ZmpB/ZmpC family metallo-endopeptidase [Streptococcus suis]
MHKFFYEQRKAFSFRKLTIGLVSLCVGTSLLFGIQSQEVSASTVSPSQIRFEYVLEAELSAEERQLIQSSLPAELKEEATYFVVYRPSKKVLPATGELAGSGLAVLGLGFLVLAVSATKSKKARVLTMLYVTTSGLALPVLEVGAVQSSALAAYNQNITIRPGDSLPDGKLRLDGYDFVGYYVQESSVKTSLPPSETEKNDVAKGTQASSVQSEGKKSDLEELAKPDVLQDNSESQLSNRDDSLQLPLTESSVEKTENTVSSETTNSQTGDGLVSPSNTSTVADKKEDTPNTEESQNSGLDSTLQIPGLLILNRKDRTDAVTEVAPVGQALPFVAFRKEKETFALELVKQEDPQLEIGKSRLVPGQEGEKEITYADFVQGEKILRSEKISEQVTKSAVAPIMYVGTKQLEAPVIPLPEVPSSPKVESEISDAGSTDANSSASQHTEQPKPSTPDSAVDLPVPPQPEVRPEVDVPVPPQPETTPETEVPVSPQPELAPETEEPVAPQPEVAPETEVSVAPQPEVVPETEEPVSPQPEVAPETEEPVSPQPEVAPETEEPVSPQPEVAPETEVPTTPNTGSTDATSGASQHGESTENPTSQELTEAEIQCILDPSSTCWPEKEEEVEPKAQAQQIEEAAAKLREKMEELQTYKSRFKGKEWIDYINTVYEASRAILEARDLADMLIQTSLIEDDLRFLLVETDANSGASQKTEGELIFELPTSTSETVTPPLTPTTPDSSGSTTPKPSDSTTAPSTETEEGFCPIDPKPEDTCGPETSPTEETPSGEGSSTSGSSGETNSSETNPSTSTIPDSSGSTTPKPSDSTTAPSTETEEEFCPIDPKPEENCGVESEPQKEIVSQVEVESTKDVSFIRRYESNDQLEFGETRTKQIGQVGQEKVIETYRLVNGERRERLSIRTENIRQAREEIIEVGTKPTVTKTPIRFTEKEIADGNLYVGDRVIEVHGVDGERTVTTSYRLNTQTGETQPEQPVVTEVAAKEQKVRIGTKPVDETRQVIQDTVVKFTTEFESDVNLSYPETQEITPGKDGLNRTIITRRYIRGQEVGQPSQEKLIITPVQNRRVKVGIKPESRIVETPFQTVYEADSSRQLDTRHTRQEGVNQQITYTKTYSMNSETGQVTAQPETGRLTRQGQNKIIQVGTRPTERTEEIVLETIRRDNSELEKGTVKVIHEGRPTIKRFQKSYTVDVNTGATVAQPEVLLEEIPGQAREEEVGTKEPVQPEVIDSTGSTETTQPEETTKPEQPINPLPEPEQPNISETEPVSPEKSEETTEETVEDVNKPLLRVLKNEPHYHLMKHVRSSKVTYKLDDQYNTFRKAIARLFVNDIEIHQEELTDKNKLEVRFRNLLPNVDYFVKTDLVYTDSNNAERTERLMDEVHIDFEERHFEIKNIDEAEVWKRDGDRLVRQVSLFIEPADKSPYFIKLQSDEHKDIFLPVVSIDEESLSGKRHFKLQAKFTNPEERRQKLDKYHDTVIVYLPREVRENHETRNKYSTFTSLLNAMKTNSSGTFELQQDLTASEVVLSDTDKSYLKNQFHGTLKGNGFTIHDLKAPLFDDLRGTVSDLNLKAVDIHLPKEKEVGALAKQSTNGSVSNVHVEGRVVADNFLGGLIGEVDRTSLSKVSFTGSLISLGKDDNKVGGIAGWLGGGSITKGYVDATISSASSNVKAGGLVGQLEHANARITSSYVTGRITTTKTKDTEVGGLVGTILKGNDTNNSIQLTDNIVAVNVVNGNKVYGRLDETLRPFSNIRIVTDKATGENNSTEFVTAIDSERAGQELKAWSIRPSEKESEWHLRQKNAFDINYANEKYTITDRKQAYENMEKLLPFFTRDVIIQHANRLESNDSLVTKKLVDAVPLIGDTPVFDIVQNKDNITRLLLHFEDGTIEKHYLVKKKELGSGAVVEYYLLDKNISYTPETYVRNTDIGPMIFELQNQFGAIQFESDEVNKVLGLPAYQPEKERQLLFLEESFNRVKSDIQTHLTDLISNYNLVGLDNSAIREYLKSYISKNKVQLLLGLAYMDKWYNIQFGDVNAKNLMMKKADFFGQNVNSLDQLIRIGSMGAEMLKPKNNYALASQVIAKESIDGDLFDYLEGYRKAFVPDKTTNDWFRTTTKATIIETNSRVPEVLEKQTNPTKDIYKNGFYDKMASNHWMYKEMALILLAMPSKDIFILTDMANTLIGMYENNKGVSEERLQEIAKMWAGHADYLYNILPDGHKEKMFRRVVTWDNKKINGSWKDPMDPSPYNLRSAAMKHFYIPLGHPHADRRTGAHANYTIDNIYYFDHEATSDDGARVYTHEMTHVADDDTILLGHGKRTSLDYEVYARGLFESITWGNQDRFGFNNVYDFSKYDKNNYGRRLTNKTPDRFQSTKDLQDYMKGYLDVIYTLDLLEAEAVIGLSDNSAKQNWFAQMTTGDGNTSTVAPVAKVPTSLEQLIKDGMVSRRPYESGYNNYGDYGSNNHSNAYLEVRAFDPIYGSLNNDGTSRNEYEVRKIAFELLAEYGYEKGMVPYLSNQHKASLGKADANGRMNDSDLISLISEKEYKNSAEFRKAMFEKRRQNLEKLKSVELINNSLSNGEGYFYEGTRTVNASELRDLMKAAVEHDARSSNYLSSTIRYNKTQSHVYSLKAAILNGYLRETKDFRESIYKDTP